jgi:uncharacterized protein YjbI with pentapeptide repeats
MDEKLEGWNAELYDKLTPEYLKKCVKYDRVEEWNKNYQAYLDSEKERLKEELRLLDESSDELYLSESFKRVSLEKIHLRGTKLGKVNFQHLILQGAELGDADLQGANLYMAYLQDANLQKAHISDANLQNAELARADLRETKLQNSDMFGAKLHNADLYEADLQNADLRYTQLEGVDLCHANLQSAMLNNATLNGANIQLANLEEAVLSNATLNGADFNSSDLQGADLSWAIVNENTSFQNINIDDATGSLLSRIVSCKKKTGNWHSILVKLLKIWREKKGTDFSNVALGTCRIDTLTKTRIEKNIRVYRWNDWYKNHVFLQIIMRPFWFLTDYGSSTKRPIFAFILWNTIFSIIYFLWLGSDFQELMTLHLSPIWENIGGNIVIFLTDWMKSNLMIISLTDMATTKIEPLTLFFVFLHVFVGYFILAALIARFSIMFQNLSPNEE